MKSSRWTPERPGPSALLLAALVALVIHVPAAAPAVGVVGPEAGRIVYVEGGDIFSIAPDGSDSGN